MSLRRSARVQALDSVVAAPQSNGTISTNGVKRKAPAGTTKATKKTAKPSPSPQPIPNATLEAEEAAFKTPVKITNKRRKVDTPKAVPFTPTPSAIGVMTSRTPLPTNNSAEGREDALVSPRPANPHIANAPLTSPNSSSGPMTAYSTFEETSDSPSKPPPAAAPTTTTSTLLADATAHLLAIDAVHFSSKLAPTISAHHCAIFSPTGLSEPLDPFRSLASGIIAQQVSGAAATSIKNKFISLFPASSNHLGPPHFPAPALVLQRSVPELRTAGLSQRKAEYISGLAQKFVDGELSAEILAKGTDEEVTERLVQVRGLGRWSVEMFCCFGLKRADVFSTGDLGVQRGIAAYIGKDVAKLKAKGGGKWKYLSEREMLEVAERFRPYRSLFMWYMWRIADVVVEAVEKA